MVERRVFVCGFVCFCVCVCVCVWVGDWMDGCVVADRRRDVWRDWASQSAGLIGAVRQPSNIKLDSLRTEALN